jgi:hypothetical protein
MEGIVVGVRVAVFVGMAVMVMVAVAVGVKVLVGVWLGAIVGVTVFAGVPITKTFDASGRPMDENTEKPLTILFSKRLLFERQSCGYIYCQSGLPVSLSNGIKDEKLHG